VNPLAAGGERPADRAAGPHYSPRHAAAGERHLRLWGLHTRIIAGSPPHASARHAWNEHEGIPSDWQGSLSNESSGSFWFWPPVSRARKSLRVTVSTLWEAAWAEIELPR